jgi:hypothetical protein
MSNLEAVLSEPEFRAHEKRRHIFQNSLIDALPQGSKRHGENAINKIAGQVFSLESLRVRRASQKLGMLIGVVADAIDGVVPEISLVEHWA